jgi:polar amino acid transport system substrate-binding protein
MMTQMNKSIPAGLALLVAILVSWSPELVAQTPPATQATPTAPAAQTTQSTLDKIKQRGELWAGVHYDYPPYGFVDKDGQPTGFVVEVAKYFANKLGVKLKIVQVTSNSRIPLIVNGNVDAEFAATTPTVKREEVIDFSIPYLWLGTTLIVRKDSDIKTVKDASAPKQVGAVQGGVLGDQFLQANPNGKLVYFQNYSQGVVAVANKRVDALSLSRVAGTAFVKQNPELTMIAEDFFRDQGAIGLRENDSKWRKWINQTLQEMWCKGEFQKAYEKFLGEPPNYQLWSPYGLQPGIAC